MSHKKSHDMRSHILRFIQKIAVVSVYRIVYGNDAEQEKALERLEELSEMPRYLRT